MTVIWFRPRWVEEESIEPLHWLVTPSDEPYEERTACGMSWPKKLNHGSFEVYHPSDGIPPSTETVCPKCVGLYRARGGQFQVGEAGAEEVRILRPVPPATEPQTFSGWSTPDGKPPPSGW